VFQKYSQQLHPEGENKAYELTTNDLCLQVAEHITCCSSFCHNQNLNITHSLNSFAPNKRLLVFANGTHMLVRINETYSEIRRLDKSEPPIALQATQKLTGDNPLAIFLNNTTPYSYSSFLVNETRTGHYELCTAKLDNAVRRSTNRFVLQHCWELPHLKLHADYVQRIALVPITQYVFAICQSWAEDRQLRYMARIYDRRTAEQAKMVAQIDGDPITAFDSATDIAFYSDEEALHSCYIKMDVSGISRIRCRRYGLENVLNVKT